MFAWFLGSNVFDPFSVNFNLVFLILFFKLYFKLQKGLNYFKIFKYLVYPSPNTAENEPLRFNSKHLNFVLSLESFYKYNITNYFYCTLS